MQAHWVIFLNYNLGSRCQRQLDIALALPDFGVFVVDNASRSEDYALLQAACQARGAACIDASTAGGDGEAAACDAVRRGERLVLYRCADNRGYAGGNNVGLRVLHRTVGDAGQFVIANPDVELNADALRALADPADEISGPAVFERFMNGITTELHRMDFATGFARAPTAAGGPVAALHGCCLKLSGRAVSRYGLLPEEYFLYNEEITFFERVHRLGGRPVYRDDVQVWHEGSAAIAKRSFIYFYYLFRNRLVYFLTVAGPRYHAYGRFLRRYGAWALSTIWSGLRRGSSLPLRAVSTGIWHGLLRRQGPYKP